MKLLINLKISNKDFFHTFNMVDVSHGNAVLSTRGRLQLRITEWDQLPTISDPGYTDKLAGDGNYSAICLGRLIPLQDGSEPYSRQTEHTS